MARIQEEAIIARYACFVGVIRAAAHTHTHTHTHKRERERERERSYECRMDWEQPCIMRATGLRSRLIERD